jgi:hypothetical protein
LARATGGLLGLAGGQPLADVTRRRAGKRDQARIVALGKVSHGGTPDLGAAMPARQQVGRSEQFAQAQITIAVLRQQQQARSAVAAGLVVGDPDVGADDRLDAGAACGGVELDHAEQVGQVGQRQGRHAVRPRPGDDVVEPGNAVGDRILAVQPQMDETRRGRRCGGGEHGQILPARPRPAVTTCLKRSRTIINRSPFATRAHRPWTISELPSI